MELKKSAHSVWRLEYHFVWIPKYRYKVLRGEVKIRLEELLREVMEYYPEFEMKKWGVVDDHVHLVISVPPKYSPAKVMQIIKANTSRKLLREFKVLRQRYWGGEFWSTGYFVSTVSEVNEETVMKYVEYQEQLDKAQLKLEF